MELVVALDLPSRDENIELLRELKGYEFWVKVGLRSFIRDGREFLETIKELNQNTKIFLDLKLYDIPNTMGDAIEEICALPVDMVSIHASSGKKGMSECVSRAKRFEKRPLIVAVTALTSFESSEFEKIYGENIDKKVTFFTKECEECGVDGVVSSVYESLAIKMAHPKLITVTPGIRLEEVSDDQARVATPSYAKSQKSDYIVVGRPIYMAKNRYEVMESILKEL